MTETPRPIALFSDTEPLPDNKTYKVGVSCANCRYAGEADLPWGVPVGEAPCPYCGCPAIALQVAEKSACAGKAAENEYSQAVRESVLRRGWSGDTDAQDAQRLALLATALQRDAMRRDANARDAPGPAPDDPRYAEPRTPVQAEPEVPRLGQGVPRQAELGLSPPRSLPPWSTLNDDVDLSR